MRGQWLGFLPSAVQRTERGFNELGALTVAGLSAHGLLAAEPCARRSLCAAMLCVWSARLAAFHYFRSGRRPRDPRWDGVRDHPCDFFYAWTSQGVWAFLTTMPALGLLHAVSLSTVVAAPLGGGMDVVGLGLWLAGLGLEVVADQQKAWHRRRRNLSEAEGRGESDDAELGWVAEGLWCYSRQPNYVGEVAMQLGMLILCLEGMGLRVAAASGWWWWWPRREWTVVLGPIYVAWHLRRADQDNLRWARQKWRHTRHEAEYEGYVQRTHLLFGAESLLSLSMGGGKGEKGG